jgi:subtilisin family serine protease
MKFLLITALALGWTTILFGQNASLASEKPNLSAQSQLLKFYLSQNKPLSADQTTGFIVSPNHTRVLFQVKNAHTVALQLNKLNIHVTAQFNDIWAAEVPLKTFPAFCEIKGIDKIEIEQSPMRFLDKALVESQIKVVHQGTNLPQPFTGKNVVLGIIDGGFDAQHPSFRHPVNGNSRISRWWNFLDTTGTPPAGFNYGSEYTQSQQILNKGTDAEDQLHGTHVAGIAGGIGDPETKGKYTGCAPDAEMVWVAIPYGDKQRIYKYSTADGLKYIFDYAQSQKKPCVINNSFGFFFGPHDGTDLLSRVCNQITGKGKIIVASAGNNGDAKAYFHKSFTTNDSVLKTFITPKSYNRDNIKFITGADIWYQPNDPSFKVGLTFWDIKTRDFINRPILYYTGEDTTIWIHDPKLADSSKIIVEFATATEKANFNGKRNTTLKVKYYDKVNYVPVLHVYSQNNQMDIWNPYMYYSSEFLNEINGIDYSNFAIGDTFSNMSATHCNSPNVIAVASYTLIDTFKTMRGSVYDVREPVGARAKYSSRGPTADGRTKPDISAPGHWIVAPGSTFDNSADYLKIEETQFLGNYYPYIALTGTSMAGPVVAGAVALLLEANSNLTPAEVIDILKTTAKLDQFTGEISNKGSVEWGWGKLNTWEAVKKALQKVSRNDALTTTQLLIYPNPVRETDIKVILPKDFSGIACLAEPTGRIIRTKSIFPTTDNEISFPVTGIASGIYLLKVYNEGRLYGVSKLIIAD